MSVRTDVLLWAQRVLAKTGAPAHQLLEVRADAPADVVSDAFQKIARMAHPDLHRSGLDPEELEMVTSAYSKVAGAYQEMRSQRNKPKPAGGEAASSIVGQRMSNQVKETPGSGVATGAMNSKALIYYRKAELALRRGDARGGLMQLKMAIAADPGSAFLRNALTEVEAEMTKKP